MSIPISKNRSWLQMPANSEYQSNISPLSREEPGNHSDICKASSGSTYRLFQYFEMQKVTNKWTRYMDKSTGPQSFLIFEFRCFPIAAGAFTSIYERMGCSKELTEFDRNIVIGYHCWNKSVHEPSYLQDIQHLTQSGTIARGWGTAHLKLQSVIAKCWCTWCVKVTKDLLTQWLQSFKPPVTLISAQTVCARS